MIDKSPPIVIAWRTAALEIDFIQNESGAICIRRLVPTASKESYPAATDDASPYFESSEVPLISVKLIGEGTKGQKTAKALIGSYQSDRLRYSNHHASKTENSEALEIVSTDETSGILVKVVLTLYGDVPVLRSVASIENISPTESIVVTQLSSFAIGGMTAASHQWHDDYTLLTATNGWFREAQWRENTLPEVGIDAVGLSKVSGKHV